MTSLDRPVGEDGDTSLGELIADDDAEAPTADLEVSLREDLLGRALAELPERERIVLESRYGLGDNQPETLQEVGRKLGITRERVRQIERQALDRLARARENEALRDLAA